MFDNLYKKLFYFLKCKLYCKPSKMAKLIFKMISLSGFIAGNLGGLAFMPLTRENLAISYGGLGLTTVFLGTL